jgi:hypothetical protein
MGIGQSKLQIGIYDIIFNSTVVLVSQDNIYKSGAGNILFVGFVTLAATTACSLQFGTGNPTVEFRNGFAIGNSASYNTGSGLISFTTNNQAISCNTTGLTPIPLDAPILISGAITITESGATPLTFNGIMNGDNASSKMIIAGTTYYNNSVQPMVTGLLDTSTNVNTFIYGSGNQDITGVTYRTLTLNGGGIKTLQGNVVVSTLYTLTPPATLNLNGYTRT